MHDTHVHAHMQKLTHTLTHTQLHSHSLRNSRSCSYTLSINTHSHSNTFHSLSPLSRIPKTWEKFEGKGRGERKLIQQIGKKGKVRLAN